MTPSTRYYQKKITINDRSTLDKAKAIRVLVRYLDQMKFGSDRILDLVDEVLTNQGSVDTSYSPSGQYKCSDTRVGACYAILLDAKRQPIFVDTYFCKPQMSSGIVHAWVDSYRSSLLGGGVNRGEDYDECMRRELIEETAGFVSVSVKTLRACPQFEVIRDTKRRNKIRFYVIQTDYSDDRIKRFDDHLRWIQRHRDFFCNDKKYSGFTETSGCFRLRERYPAILQKNSGIWSRERGGVDAFSLIGETDRPRFVKWLGDVTESRFTYEMTPNVLNDRKRYPDIGSEKRKNNYRKY